MLVLVIAMVMFQFDTNGPIFFFLDMHDIPVISYHYQHMWAYGRASQDRNSVVLLATISHPGASRP